MQVPRLASHGSAFPAMWRRTWRAMKSHMRTLRYPHPTELESGSFWREGRETPRSNACPHLPPLHRGAGQSLTWLSKWKPLPTALNYWKMDIYCPRGVQLSELLGLLTRQKMPVEWATLLPFFFSLFFNSFFFKFNWMWERQVWNCFWVMAEELLLSNLGWFQKAFQFSEK